MNIDNLIIELCRAKHERSLAEADCPHWDFHENLGGSEFECCTHMRLMDERVLAIREQIKKHLKN